MWKAVLACVVMAAGTASAQSELLGGMCPMVTKGARVAMVETPDGAELDFSIAGDPTLLRARVHQIALSQNQVPGRMTVIGEGVGAREVQAVPSHAQADDTSTGARLILTADDPAQIAELRQQVRAKVADCQARGH